MLGVSLQVLISPWDEQPGACLPTTRIKPNLPVGRQVSPAIWEMSVSLDLAGRAPIWLALACCLATESTHATITATVPIRFPISREQSGLK